jgi:CRP-like cAMP-binding protein
MPALILREALSEHGSIFFGKELVSQVKRSMGKFSTLEKADLTKDWSIEERAALGHFLSELKVPEKESIFTTKSTGRILYILGTGKARILIDSIEVDLTEGESIGELSIVHPSAKMVGAIALEPCVFWVLTLDKWEDMKRAAPIISLKLIEKICEKMAKLLNHSFDVPRAVERSSLASPLRAPGTF